MELLQIQSQHSSWEQSWSTRMHDMLGEIHSANMKCETVSVFDKKSICLTSDKEITTVKILLNSFVYGQSASPKWHGFDCVEKCVTVTALQIYIYNSSKRRNTIINCS